MTIQDHDQRFKVLLRKFFKQFFMLFWPEFARRFDFDRVEWLEQETFPDPPPGARRVLDLVARLPLREPVQLASGEACAETLVAIHLEVESRDAVGPLRKTMHAYFSHLRLKHPEAPILPVAVYLRVGLKGIGVDTYVERFGELEVFRDNYLYVRLPALDAEEFSQRDEPLGWALASLMKLPKERLVRERLS